VGRGRVVSESSFGGGRDWRGIPLTAGLLASLVAFVVTAVVMFSATQEWIDGRVTASINGRTAEIERRIERFEQQTERIAAQTGAIEQRVTRIESTLKRSEDLSDARYEGVVRLLRSIDRRLGGDAEAP
jgi:septal ring factor EnvC (AmiA/AmiB activator)